MSEFRDAGLLWMVNKTTFHPLGYQLALDIEDGTGEVLGWCLRGDGTELHSFSPEDEKLGSERSEATLRAAAKENSP